MKKLSLIVSVSLLCLSFKTFSQEKVDRYCVVFTDYKFPLKSKDIIIDYGQIGINPVFKDSLVIKSLEKAKLCKSEADILNYFGSMKWALVTRQTVSGGSTIVFKKQFDINELLPEQIN